ncbi:MAG: hypothetical protein LBQ48_04260 [Oscillospiraceae bacterium]|jgi:hypothetical protein|nr:hypothetical protein [Oscillospiraceae bacterium]
MTKEELSRFITTVGDSGATRKLYEEAVKEVAGLISGCLVFRLCRAIRSSGHHPHAITAHLEMLWGNNNHFGLVYFIALLAGGTGTDLPGQFVEFAAAESFVPYLAAALMDDWLDCHEDFEL